MKMIIRKGWAEHERRLRHRMIDLGVRPIDVARALNMHRSNVTRAIRGYSWSNGQIERIFDYLGLETPNLALREDCKTNSAE